MRGLEGVGGSKREEEGVRGNRGRLKESCCKDSRGLSCLGGGEGGRRGCVCKEKE